MPSARILIVDYHEQCRSVLIRHLRKARKDLEVVEVENGAQAVAEVEGNPPDLIFMEMKLPVVDGWEATRRIRASDVGRDIPIIGFDWRRMYGEFEKMLQNGCNAYLRKVGPTPIIDADEVRSLVERFVTDLKRPTDAEV